MPTDKKEKGEVKKSPVSAKTTEVKPKVTKKSSKKVVAKTPPPVEKKKPEPLVAFSVWFRAKRFKPHWAAGMQAYADTTKRRTVADWDRLFKGY
jgi:hypothetical protein